jgi:hypothetical protein
MAYQRSLQAPASMSGRYSFRSQLQAFETTPGRLFRAERRSGLEKKASGAANRAGR